jgi:hypothetical protein
MSAAFFIALGLGLAGLLVVIAGVINRNHPE